MTLPREPRAHGFTLVELLIVLAILALGVGLAMPLLATREPAMALGGATQQVRAARQVIEGLGLEVATPAEARALLQLKGAANVAF